MELRVSCFAVVVVPDQPKVTFFVTVGRGDRMLAKTGRLVKEKSRGLLLCFLRPVPSPRYLPTAKLLKRGFRARAGGLRVHDITHDAIGNGAEGAHAGRALRHWVGVNVEVGVDASGSGARIRRVEGISALGTRGQQRVDQAGGSGTGDAAHGSGPAGAQIAERAGEAYAWVGSYVRHLGGDEGANRRHCGRLVGRNLGTQQIRDRNRGDDQDDGNDD